MPQKSPRRPQQSQHSKQTNNQDQNGQHQPGFNIVALILVPIIVALIGAAAVIAVPILERSQPSSSQSLPIPRPTLVPSPATPQHNTPTTVAGCANVGSSSLIPSTPPALCDPLSNPSNPNQWQTGLQGSVTCSFVGGTYQLSAPANSSGGGCAAQSSNATFTNFVYQIEMTIKKGLMGNGGTTGVGFCASNASNGSLYEVNFDAHGYWNFGVLTGANTPNSVFKIIRSGTSPLSLIDVGQPNYFTVKVQGHKIDVQINGHPLFSLTDTTLTGGTIGVGLTPGNENAIVAFSDAIVWQV